MRYGDVKANTQRLWQLWRRGKLPLPASIHRQHPFWGKVIWLLDHIWHFIWLIWGGLGVLGLIFSSLDNFLITGSFGADPRQWHIILLIEANPVRALGAAVALVALTTLSGLSHTLAHDQARQLLRVGDLKPGDYVPKYIEGIYLPRLAPDTGVNLDVTAREALQSASSRPDPADPLASLGFCVYGRTMLGKTRLAWEALRETLPDWRFYKWRHDSNPDIDWNAIRGEKIGLWLDDAQEYANPNEGPGLTDLPRRFAEAGAHLVIVATCRAGDDEQKARQYLGGLLDRLTPIRPADISRDDEQRLAQELSAKELGAQDVHLESDQFDGTPGSLLLGVARMRDQIYPALPEDAQGLLRAMKLLRGCGVYVYPARRLRGVAAGLFGTPDTFPAYSAASEALVSASFVRRGAMDDEGLFALDPVADAYLESAIPDFPPSGVAAHTYWLMLRNTLEAMRDADALVSLGIAFIELRIGLNPDAPHDLRANKQQSRACYEFALTIFAPSSLDWATAQNNLGVALYQQAELVEGEEQANLLGKAVGAFHEALTVRTPENAALDWAGTKNNLGAALSGQAELEKGEKRARLLREAVGAYRAALTVYTGRASAALNLAATQKNLGDALRAQAQMAAGEEQARLLSEAVGAFHEALRVYDRESAGHGWAGVQTDLGAALAIQAGLAEGEERARLLREAEVGFRAALTVYTRKSDAPDWAATQFNLALLYCNLANDAPSDAAAAALRRDALVAVQRASEVFAGTDPVRTALAARLRAYIEEMLDKVG